jgi:hypothetical protein
MLDGVRAHARVPDDARPIGRLGCNGTRPESFDAWGAGSVCYTPKNTVLAVHTCVEI